MTQSTNTPEPVNRVTTYVVPCFEMIESDRSSSKYGGDPVGHVEIRDGMPLRELQKALVAVGYKEGTLGIKNEEGVIQTYRGGSRGRVPENPGLTKTLCDVLPVGFYDADGNDISKQVAEEVPGQIEKRVEEVYAHARASGHYPTSQEARDEGVSDPWGAVERFNSRYGTMLEQAKDKDAAAKDLGYEKRFLDLEKIDGIAVRWPVQEQTTQA